MAAIIGILAAIAIPNFLKYQAKSRQAEARSSLTGVFVAEVSFFSEIGRFGSFNEIGYTLTGTSNRYSYRSPVNGGVGGCPSTGAVGSSCYIPAGVGTGGHAADNMVVPSNATNVGLPAFTATAVSNIDSDLGPDEWHVNHLKDDLVFPDTDDYL